MKNIKKLVVLPALGAAILLGGGITGYANLASAQGTPKGTERPARMPGVHGEITSISGTTIAIKSMNGETYTIDAGSATVTKNRTASSLSALVVGERIMTEGTVTDKTVAATKITAGAKPGFAFGNKLGHKKGPGPGVMGTVTAVNGSMITVTGHDGKSYTVNAGNATVQKHVAGTLADISVGETIGVQGTVSGTIVTATTIMDGLPSRLAK